MADTDLIFMSAMEAGKRFRDRSLSPVELLDALIARYDAIAETVNPFADRYFELAKRQAREAEAVFAGTEGHARSLEGIPLAVKDMSNIAGQRTTDGSIVYADAVPAETDTDIQRLLDAGAIVFARTTCPEFGWLYTTQSRMWGVTHNPWRHGVSPGGSSGGSAAALAAGAATLATGSDLTGSIRQPASQCGIVAYQAPYGRIPMVGAGSFQTYCHLGPMARTVTDCAVMANLMSGYDARDHNSLVDTISLPTGNYNAAGMKIAVSMDLGVYEVSEDVARETRASVEALRAAGAVIEDVDIDWAAEVVRLSHGSQEFLFAGYLNDVVAEHGDLVSDYVRELLETADSFTAADYRRSVELAGEVWRDHLGPLFRDYDALITPTTTCPDIPANGWQKNTIEVNGRRVTDTETSMTAIWNMFGRCPVIAVPSGIADSGVPTGIQVVGRPYDEPTVFRIAGALEKQKPWSYTRQPYPGI
ncbi:MAG: amidase [Alphaproteobacteria bacterium]